ncbi:SNF5-domain-containing protein [Lindgomyces ingoldianus]|uniref:SNF5-domain-containing protein n=1 Tax=Lindgomyces ingoldianus TaxID=673940 RepID=A0ACB6RFG3_9PLEO|nr:SNF5-domain-containing protein [Lindgomyces ingoldianus]KAF2477946.1 SNF5-domain-containing protein [Lindgomyces ingoldianus]
MPAPINATQPDQSFDAAVRQPRSAYGLEHSTNGNTNGNTNGKLAVQTPDVATVGDGAEVARGESKVIQEGKEKAKTILAASGMPHEADITQASSSQSKTVSPATTGTVNGVSPSRKRSRSGSRIPSHASAQKKDEPWERCEDDYLLELYKERDFDDLLTVTRQMEYSTETLTQAKALFSYYRDEVHPIRVAQPGAIFGYGYMGYGNGYTDMKGPRLQYPAQAKRPGNRLSRPVRVSKKDVTAQAEQIEDLVPVRLDIELDKIKLRDTFTWNLHDRVTPPDVFAENLVEDFKLPPEFRGPLIQQINREIQEQITDFYPHPYIPEEPLDSHLPYSAYKNDEMRILIKLNITIGAHTLVDQFEWEMNNPLNSPEEFARQMAADLSLSGEFTTAIAHSIREQCQMFTKSLYITGHPFDGRPVEDSDIRDNFLPSPLPSVFRPMQSAKDFTPYLYELSEADLERAELSIMREQRRQKRSVNRRGGPALPDLKDRQRTARTLVVSSVLPGAAETTEDSRMFKISRSSKRAGGRPGRTDGGDDSDESDSDESVAESPAPSQLTGGTARTRNMRTAANAAQAAMRSAMGRSATPEISTLHHHETRTSARRLGHEVREESVSEPTSLVVKLRISAKKFREYLQNPKPLPKPASTPVMAPTPPPARSATSMPPPPSPAMPPRSTPANGAQPVEAPSRIPSTPTPAPQPQQQWQYYPDGRADAPYPLPPGSTSAPPPPWLQNALQELREKNPNDLFEATMRYNIIDQKTQSTVKADQLTGSATLPPGIKAQWLPRIRCIDCPGKLYTAGPGLTVENFEVHLKNRQHKASVERRTGKTSAS